MVDPLKPFNYTALVRALGTAKGAGASARPSNHTETLSRPAGEPQAGDAKIRERLVESLQGLSIDSEEALLKAGRVFVMTVFEFSFGVAVWRDSKFSDLATEVLQDLLADPCAKRSLQRELRNLSEASA